MNKTGYTTLGNLITNETKTVITADQGLNKKNMKPELQSLLLARTAIISQGDGELTAIRIFDTIFVPKELNQYYLSFWVIGRLLLNIDSIPVEPLILKGKIQIFDPTGKEISFLDLDGIVQKPERGININGNLPYVLFENFDPKPHTIIFSVGINGSSLEPVGTPVKFWVEKSK